MRISGRTRVVGLFGYPVEHTLSPVMQNAAFSHCNLDYCYIPFTVRPENLRNGIDAIRSLNLCGANLTIPHKETVIPFLDRLDEEARSIGAVNTVTHRPASSRDITPTGKALLLPSGNEAFTLTAKGPSSSEPEALPGQSGTTSAGLPSRFTFSTEHLKKLKVWRPSFPEVREMRTFCRTSLRFLPMTLLSMPPLLDCNAHDPLPV